MSEERLEIFSDGLILQGVLHKPPSSGWPLVVLCHGFLSHKDGSKYLQLARTFAGHGIATLRFDFRGCGQSEGSLGESTVSGRWRDLRKVVSLAETLEGFGGSLGLLGSSLGGYLALLEASRNPLVRCVVVWATPSNLQGLAKRLPEVAPVTMSREFYEDLGRVELVSRLTDVDSVLVVHGQQDHLVPPEHALRVFSSVKQPKSLEVMADADHSFSQPEAREQAVRRSLAWFRQFL